MKFGVTIQRDEDGFFVAEVPALPGCVSQGAGDQALDNVRDAISLYLESLKAHGDQIPPPMDEEVIEVGVSTLCLAFRVATSFAPSKSAAIAFDRQTGSHMILRTSAPPFRRLVVLDHREIAKRTLRAIMRQAGVTVDDLIALL